MMIITILDLSIEEWLQSAVWSVQPACPATKQKNCHCLYANIFYSSAETCVQHASCAGLVLYVHVLSFQW